MVFNTTSQVLRRHFFVQVLDGATRKPYFENCHEYMKYVEIVEVMLSKYDSDSWQVKVKGTLETLRLKLFMEEEEISDISEGLTMLIMS